MIAPFPLLFFGGDISVLVEEGHETVAVDEFIKFKSPTKIANLVKVRIPGGVFNKVLYGEAPPRGPNPDPFIYHF